MCARSLLCAHSLTHVGVCITVSLQVLDFMRLGSCMPREAWRLFSPQPLHKHWTCTVTKWPNDTVTPDGELRSNHVIVCSVFLLNLAFSKLPM